MERKRFSTGHYAGNKLGGKYLRASDMHSIEERKEAYWSVCELVKQRLDKAKSLKEE